MSFLTSFNSRSCWVPQTVSAVVNWLDNRPSSLYSFPATKSKLRLYILDWEHYLVIIWSVQTGLCCKPFKSITNDITSTLHMACLKEELLCWLFKAFTVALNSKCFLVLYWAAHPSQRQTIFLSGYSNVFSVNFIRCQWMLQNLISLSDSHALYS